MPPRSTAPAATCRPSTLPLALDLDALFARAAQLFRAQPPHVLLRQLQLQQCIPSDSPLLLAREDASSAEELPPQLANHLDWKHLLLQGPHVRTASSSSETSESAAPHADSSAVAAAVALKSDSFLIGNGLRGGGGGQPGPGASAQSRWLQRTPTHTTPN